MSRLVRVFEGQRELIKKFNAIERQTVGLGDEGIPVNLHTYAGQARVRECAGRVSEEVSETIAAMGTPNFLDEVADVLSFLIELFIVIGCTEAVISPHCGHPEHDSLWCSYARVRDAIENHPDRHPEEEPMDAWSYFVVGLWSWIHDLKAKPWKLNPKPTDAETFVSNAHFIFMSFINTCYFNSISDEELYNAYAKKQQINLVRIRTKA